jgi:hypothetical protein
MNELLAFFGVDSVPVSVFERLLEWKVKPNKLIVGKGQVIIRVYDHPALYKFLQPELMDIKANGRFYQADMDGVFIQWVQSNVLRQRSIRNTPRTWDVYAE